MLCVLTVDTMYDQLTPASTTMPSPPRRTNYTFKQDKLFTYVTFGSIFCQGTEKSN